MDFSFFCCDARRVLDCPFFLAQLPVWAICSGIPAVCTAGCPLAGWDICELTQQGCLPGGETLLPSWCSVSFLPLRPVFCLPDCLINTWAQQKPMIFFVISVLIFFGDIDLLNSQVANCTNKGWSLSYGGTEGEEWWLASLAAVSCHVDLLAAWPYLWNFNTGLRYLTVWIAAHCHVLWEIRPRNLIIAIQSQFNTFDAILSLP